MIRHSRKRDQRGSGPGGEKGRGMCSEFHLLGGTWDARGWGLAVLGWETQACPEEPRVEALFLKERNLQ